MSSCAEMSLRKESMVPTSPKLRKGERARMEDSTVEENVYFVNLVYHHGWLSS